MHELKKTQFINNIFHVCAIFYRPVILEGLKNTQGVKHFKKHSNCKCNVANLQWNDVDLLIHRYFGERKCFI